MLQVLKLCEFGLKILFVPLLASFWGKNGENGKFLQFYASTNTTMWD